MGSRSLLRRLDSNVTRWCVLATLAGCTGAIGGDPRDDAPPPPDVVPKNVPATPEVLESVASCSALRAGEQVLSISPEGHAWLVVPGSPSSVRVLDPFDNDMGELIQEIELTDFVEVQAWSGVDATLIANEGLWRLEDFARVELTPPEGFETPASFCGDASDNGTLLSSGLVFERRQDEWWAWNPGFADEAAPTSVVRFDGECQSSDNVMWLTAQDGTVFRVEPAQYSRPIKFASLVDSAATGTMLAMLEADRLWIGPEDWQSWVFSGATPTQLSASDGHLWMVSGDQLLRFDGTDYVEVSHEMDEPIERVVAHPGGVWLVGSETLCHQALGPMLRVEGMRPYLRSVELVHEIGIKASDASEDVIAELDGEPIELTLDTETGWLQGEARLQEVGWHTLELRIEGASPEVHRSILVKRVPDVERSWATDIEPIYQENCASSDCHRSGATDPPDLSTFEAWIERSNDIRTQVVEQKNMPPAANVGPDWGQEQIETISQWLEGGMLP